MSRNEKIAQEILPLLGGQENINDYTHCVTRLRLSLKDNKKADKVAIEAVSGVMGATIVGEQFQVILGDKVEGVYGEFSKLVGDRQLTSDDAVSSERSKGFKGLFSRFLDTLSGIFVPIIPAIIGAGLLKGIIIFLMFFELVSTKSMGYQLLNIFSDGAFYFLPILIAFSSARKFNANQYVAASIAGILLHPSMGTLLNGDSSVNILGIPITAVSYASTVIPIILGVWFMSYIEKGLKRILPKILHTIFLPVLTVIIVVPVILVAFGPIGVLVGNGLGEGFVSLYMEYGWLAGLLLGGLYPLLILTGMHVGLLPVMVQSLSKFGLDYIMGIGVASNSAQAGATFAVYLRTKNKDFKAVAGTAALNAFIGVTEPAVYGVTARLKKPLIAAAIAGALGGTLMGIFKVGASGIGTGPIAGIPLFFGATFVYYLLACAVSFVIAMILTFVIGFQDIPEKKEATVEITPGNEPEEEEDNEGKKFDNPERIQAVVSPIKGEVIILSEVSDPAFAAGMMGKGIAIRPTSGRVVSPVSGTIATVFKKKHAIVVVADTGAEILLHIGIDTVKLNGQFFATHVEVGQHVEPGDLLVEFDIEGIQKAGYDTVTPIIVANTNDYLDVIPQLTGKVDEKDPLFKVVG